MKRLIHLGGAWLLTVVGVAVPAWAQVPGGTGSYSGPSLLSRWSRMGGGVGSRGPFIRAFVTGTYSYMDGLIGPVTQISSLPSGSATPEAVRIDSAGVQNLVGAGGVSLSRSDSRSGLTLGYQASYSRAFSKTSNVYQGLNQDLNINYERQLSRRWGFYTGHMAGTQSSILGLARQTDQRNLFDNSYTIANEALDTRSNFFNSSAGVFFQVNRKLTFSWDGGVFYVNRRSSALASARGERAQGEISYRISRNQSIGAVYSFSHFYFPRGFGETYTHSVMLATSRVLNRHWMLQLAAGPYQSESERLQTVAVDPFIAQLTGNKTTIAVFHGKNYGIGGSISVSANYRKNSFGASFRRGVDPGNGVTLSAVNDFAQSSWSYHGSRKWSLGATVYGSRLKPLLVGAERRADFRSVGGAANYSYRIAGPVHFVATFAAQTIRYDLLHITQLRRSYTVGLGYSPGEFALSR